MQDAIGVIGGLGPAATAYFQERVIEFSQVNHDQDHINMIIFNHATIPDRTAFITGQSPSDPLPMIIQDAQSLEALGCTFLVMPCNTAHYFYEDVQQAVHIPLVHIVQETLRYAKAHIPNLQCVGIMATNGTICTDTYQRFAEAEGLSWVVPEASMQDKVMHIIYDGVKAGHPVSKADFDAVANHLRELGAGCLILGCTELSVLKREFDLNDPDILDSIDVLAYETVRRCDKPMTEKARLLEGATKNS